jgi:hypothetical protein
MGRYAIQENKLPYLSASPQALRPRIKHLRPIIAPSSHCWISRRHPHLTGVIRMQQVKWRPRIAAAVVNAEPSIVVLGVQD